MTHNEAKSNKSCFLCARKTTWIDLLSSSGLMIFKLIVGLFTGSAALVASALYSFNDVISSIAVLVGLNYSKKEGTEDHPFGYGNAEYVVSIFTGIIMIIFSGLIFYESFETIFHGKHAHIHWAASVTALISIFANAILYKFDQCAVKHMNSPSVRAQADHHSADTLSSVIVFLGLQLDKFGYYHLDPLIAIFETVHLVVLSVEMFLHASKGLMEHSIGKQKYSVIRNIVSNVHGVKGIKEIKTRQIGGDIWIDLFVSVGLDLKVAEADKIAGNIRFMLAKNIKHLSTVHIMFV